MRRITRNILILVSAVALIVGAVWSYTHLHKTSTLIRAIEAKDVYKVKAILDEGVDPNKTDRPPLKIWSLIEITPRRPLSLACRTGSVEIVKLLIEYGATAESVEGTGFSPLRETLFYYQPDDVEIVRILLANGAELVDINDGDTVFLAAQMIPKVYDDQMLNGTVFAGDYDETTAKGIAEIVFTLLADRSINYATQSGKTLLMFAVQKENAYLAERLIEAGADLSVKDTNGKTAYDYAIEVQNRDMISLLEKTGDGSVVP